VLRVSVPEGGSLRTDAADGTAQVLDRDRSEESGNISGKEVHERIDRLIAQCLDEAGFPVV
jgi:hypothetical protein